MKKKFIDILNYIKFFELLLKISRNKNSVTVLAYHSIVPDSNSGGGWLHLKCSSFREQLEYITKNFEIVSLQDLQEKLSGSCSKPLAVITFDDGYANNYTVAYPILKELSIPFTIFLVTSKIDKDYLFWWDRLHVMLLPTTPEKEIFSIIESLKKDSHPKDIDKRVETLLFELNCDYIPIEISDLYRTLRTPEIKIMAESGLATFGSHTHRHELLTSLSPEESLETLRTSLFHLNGIPGHIKCIAYPNGYYNSLHKSQCRILGYTSGVSTNIGHHKRSDDLFSIKRFCIGSNLKLSEFKYVISSYRVFLKRFVN